MAESKSSSSGLNASDQDVTTSSTKPTQLGPFVVTTHTHIGRRKNQEDRLVSCPQLLDGEYAFYGVFDGTVKEHASEWVHLHVLEVLLACPSFVEFHALDAAAKRTNDAVALLQKAVQEMYAETDRRLIEYCAENEYHYSSTTAVTVLIHVPTGVMLTGHLGDSHVVVGTVDESNSNGDTTALVGRSITPSHKPDNAPERKRIEANGGSVVYLHDCHNKPFIRGGDFHQRNHAMQLNYSRAFGGKDLKMYGLSAIPDVTAVRVKKLVDASSDQQQQQQEDQQQEEKKSSEGMDKVSVWDVRVILLGSDGIWDVIQPHEGVQFALQALERYQSASGGVETPSELICQIALQRHVQNGSNDNVTLIAAFL